MAAKDAEFARLLTAIMPRLTNAAMLFLGSRRDGEDLASEVCLRAWSRRHQWQGKAFDAWIFKIFHNRKTDWFRDQGKLPEVDTELVETTGADQHRPNPEQALLLDELFHQIWEQLPPHYQDVVYQVKFEGQSYHEAAEILGVPAGTIMSRMNRARRIIERLKVCRND